MAAVLKAYSHSIHVHVTGGSRAGACPPDPTPTEFLDQTEAKRAGTMIMLCCEIYFLTLCPAYQEKRSTLFEYLNKEYTISVNRMAPDDVFLLLINPPSKNKPVQKLIAKYVFDCYEKRRSLVL